MSEAVKLAASRPDAFCAISDGPTGGSRGRRIRRLASAKRGVYGPQPAALRCLVRDGKPEERSRRWRKRRLSKAKCDLYGPQPAVMRRLVTYGGRPGSANHTWKGGAWNPGSWAWANKVLNAAKSKSRLTKTVCPAYLESEIVDLITRHSGVCEICGAALTDSNRAVDHCHVTGRLRGLLCNACNLGIGLLRDCPDSLIAAVEYIHKYEKGAITHAVSA